MSAAVVAPDEYTAQQHLAGAAFQAGAAQGRWRLVDVRWPFVLLAVSAAERPCGPAEFVLRLEMSGYPHIAPTGSLWDCDQDCSLAAERRPKGDRAAQLFRTDGWTGGPTAMYAPWDRVGLQSHPDWAQAYPREAWHPNRDVTFILANVHQILTADDYLGV
jgi:hypothetical protein